MNSLIAAALRPATSVLAAAAGACVWLAPVDGGWGGPHWEAAVGADDAFPSGRCLTFRRQIDPPADAAGLPAFGALPGAIAWEPVGLSACESSTVGFCVGRRFWRTVRVGPVALLGLAAAWGACGWAVRRALRGARPRPDTTAARGTGRRRAGRAVGCVLWPAALLGAALVGLGVPATVGGWEVGLRAVRSSGFVWDDRYEEWEEDFDRVPALVLSFEWFRAREGDGRPIFDSRVEEERDRPASVRRWRGAVLHGYTEWTDHPDDERPIGGMLHVPAWWLAGVPAVLWAASVARAATGRGREKIDLDGTR